MNDTHASPSPTALRFRAPRGEARWSVRRTLAFSFATSAVLWGAIVWAAAELLRG